MARTLVKTDKRGWYMDAADPEGKKVRKQDDDEIFDNIVEAQSALAVLQKAHGSRAENGKSNGKSEQPVTMAPTGKPLVGKTLTIKCKKRGCDKTRVIKPQDKFQVKFCVEHQAEHRKEIRRQKQKERTAKRRAAREAAKASA